MQRMPRRERMAIGLWLIMAVIAWNGIYDLLLTRGVKEYLFRNALHAAGLGPDVPMTQIMEVTVRDAVRVCTFWASVILLAGMVTIRLMRRSNQHPH